MAVMTKRLRKVVTASLLAALPLLVGNEALAAGKDQPELTNRVKSIITVDSKKFKDLNGNGKLDAYEDWRLSVDKRVENLVSLMTVEEKVGLLHASSHYMGTSNYPIVVKARGNKPAGLLLEEDIPLKVNPFGSPGQELYEYDPPIISHSGTTKGVTERHLRYFIVRDNPPARELTEWTNKIQEIAEGTRLGIPAILVSNPRNHVGNTGYGLMEASRQLSIWPGELGLAATFDPQLVKEFAQIAAKEWNAVGIRKGYMYMADIATDPLWMRTTGTMGESPELVSKYMTAIVKGFQGDQLGPNSISLTTKHFPGAGTRLSGHDPHYSWGKPNPYPTAGSLFKYHLPPFQAAIDAGTASIMPYYAKFDNSLNAPQLPNGQKFEEVGFAFNKYVITDLLRKQMGFKGYVNSDTGIIYSSPWGLEQKPRPELYAIAMEAGVDMFSGEASPNDLMTAVKSGLVKEDRLNVSVKRILTEIVSLGVLENPYRDPELAQKIAKDPESQKKADIAHRKSVVLLRNDDQFLPLTDTKLTGEKLYVEIFPDKDGKATTEIKKAISAYDPTVILTDNLNEATKAMVYVIPGNVKDTPDKPITVALNATNGINADKIRTIEDKVPTLLVVNMVNPWLIHEVAEKATAVVSVFGINPEPLMDVLRGRFAPTGKLPFTIPASQEAIDKSKSDVPGYDEVSSYAYKDKHDNSYTFGFGLTY